MKIEQGSVEREYFRLRPDKIGARIRTKTDLVGVLVRPSVNAVVRRVETTFGEPGNVAVLETTCSDGSEGAVPVKELAGGLRVNERRDQINAPKRP